MRLLLVWILNAIALLAVAYLFPGVQIQDWQSAAIAALVLGLVNAVIKPILVHSDIAGHDPDAGLFLLVINALLFWAVASLLPDLTSAALVPPLLALLLYSVIAWLFRC